MRKLFIAALALGAMVACNNGMEEVATTPATGNEVALVSVSLKAAGDMTRAAVGEYEDGESDERVINNATFYFFDEDGAAYPVKEGTNAVTVTATDLTNDTDAENAEDGIEAYSNVILAIKQHMDTPPAQIVALINVNNPSQYDNTSIDDLKEKTIDYSIVAKDEDDNDKTYFTMSNSVYEFNGKEVYAAQILPENIFTTSIPAGEEGAVYPATGETADVNAVPVQIYVERVAAKVRVNVSATANANGAYPVLDKNGSAIADTYVNILGWDVTNAAQQSYLLKNYATTTLFSPVNNPAFFRSYWAKTTEDVVAPTHGYSYNNVAAAYNVGGVAYYNENTLSPSNGSDWYNDNTATGATNASQLLVAAQLVDANGNAKEFGTWYGKTYTQIDDVVTDGVTTYGLKSNMINNAKKQIFVKKTVTIPAEEVGGEPTTEDQYFGITSSDVDYYQVSDEISYYASTNPWTGDRRYEVRVKAKANETYYYPTVVDGETVMVAYASADAVDAVLNKIEPATIWKSGQTYYYTIIKHFGNAEGVVRNHLYDIDIQSFTGFGTPVYDPTKIIIPEKPADQEFYNMTAKINVLEWALVSQDVELGK